MSVTGVCSVCGTANARSVCDRCGNVVCDDHYDAATGFCENCAAEVRGGRGADTDESGPSGPR